MLRIGLVQMTCEKAACAQNLQAMAGVLARAQTLDMNIVGFPEMNITGYADPLRYPQAVVRLDGPEVQQFLALTAGRKPTVLAGLIEENTAGKPFITQAVGHDGQLLGCYRKRTIKDEETRWFSAGDAVPVFECNGLKYGISICADISNESVFADCARQGARIVFELAAPGLYGEQENRNWQTGFEWWRDECRNYLSRYARMYGLWIAVATQAGRTVDEDFPGGGYVFAPDGQRLFATPDWSAGEVFLELDLEHHSLIVI